MKQTLNDKLNGLKDLGIEFPIVSKCITSNLNQNFSFRPYQLEAFSRFIYYLGNKAIRQKPAHLLFHMATGSGKTMIMAGCILYLYELGYRNFIFFVNSNNIIEKTRDNFLNPSSSKYLLSNSIIFNNSTIQIKEVESFQAVNEQDINIVFSTIQALHSKLNIPRENTLTYEDFEDKKIVLISDEAHHINAETKRKNELNPEEKDEILSWESTVRRIFFANTDNILLEFTATADLSNPDIENKYSDKIIIDYPLKQFRSDGYSKEVKILQADLPPFERALQAVLLSQYRRKVFEKNGKNVKPVILFKSKTIKESNEFYEEFRHGISNLKVSKLKTVEKSKPDKMIKKVFDYLHENNIDFQDFILELKEDFSDNKLISVNSKDESEQKQLAINSLEDENNEFRAVFAVDKLNEGWDVLNLFDIVRLYNTRDAGKTKIGKTTMSEAQLIGRGARYFPFQIVPEQPRFMRKYDKDLNNELRICEELYYHSAYNPKYIMELNSALEEIGLKAKNIKECEHSIKSDFKNTPFFNNSYIYINKRQINDHSKIFCLDSQIQDQTISVTLRTGLSKSTNAFSTDKISEIERDEKELKLITLGTSIVQKAINKLEFYQFSNLKIYFPNLESIHEFITSSKYLGNIKVEIKGLSNQINNLSAQDKLDIIVQVLDEISSAIITNDIEYYGTKEFTPYPLKEIIKDKIINYSVNGSEDRELGKSMSNSNETAIYLDLSKKDWYIFNDNYGTSEEKFFIKYFDKIYDKLKEKYNKVYLVRNERYFQIYNFEDGRPFEPDFVLLLTDKSSEKEIHYQIFIEPKGTHLIEHDKWKEDFLLRLKNDGKIEQLWKNRKYVIWGMPFYNEALKSNFDKELKTLF